VKLGVCAQVLYHLPFAEALDTAAALGFETIEIPVDAGSPFVDLDACLAGDAEDIGAAVSGAGLSISALSNHHEGQLLLGPHGVDTDGIAAGGPDEKARHGRDRLIRSAQLAHRLGVPTVLAFTGCEDYSRWFPWPLPDGYERMAATFRERVLPVLDAYGDLGVTLSLECHPRQFAYNLETAEWAVDLVDGHESLTFNLDPANLMLAGMDPVEFVAAMGERIRHVHAKDGQLVRRNAGRSGLLAHGAWNRPDRGFRFRVPGWGDLDWRELITELQVAGYDGVLSVEHEDPTMSQIEGLRQAVAHLGPILLRDPPPVPFW
jgi:sugar phosphate isomerase/epimerase